MTDPRYSSHSSGARISSYSSLKNAVPMNYQSSSPPKNNRGGQVYAQASVNHGHSSPQAYHGGYDAPVYGGGASGYTSNGTSAQYPATPYTSGSGTQYSNTTAQNMQYPPSHPQFYSSSTPSYNTTHPPASYSYGGSVPGPYAGQYTNFQGPDPGTSIKQCYNCGKMSTPLWRRDPTTQRTLCNACGLYQQQRHEPRPQALIDVDNDEDEDEPPIRGDGPQCSECGARKTSVWRRNKDGEQVCNACGVYYRVNGRPRPNTMAPSKVKPRGKH